MAPIAPIDPMPAYLAGPNDLEASLAGATVADLDRVHAPGTWSVRQVVHHVVDGDALWAMAIRSALGASGCTFQFDFYGGNDRWAAALDYAARDLQPALALFRVSREHVGGLVRDLPDAYERFATMKPGTWERRLTVAEMLEVQATHASQHVEDIRRLLDR